MNFNNYPHLSIKTLYKLMYLVDSGLVTAITNPKTGNIRIVETNQFLRDYISYKYR